MNDSLTLSMAALPFWLALLLIMLLGAIWGSFVGALVSRWPKGKTIMTGRSACDQCGTTIAPYDLVPIISFFMLRGKCRHCGSAIGAATIGIELTAAFTGALSLLILPSSQGLAAALFGWLLLPLAIFDYRHLWLPNALVILLAVTGLLVGSMLTPSVGWADRAIAAAVAFIALEAVRLAYRKFRRREGMGAGDPKLFAALGIWLGWQSLPVTLLLASAIGLGNVLTARSFGLRPRAALPLGSYLAASALLIALSA